MIHGAMVSSGDRKKGYRVETSGFQHSYGVQTEDVV